MQCLWVQALWEVQGQLVTRGGWTGDIRGPEAHSLPGSSGLVQRVTGDCPQSCPGLRRPHRHPLCPGELKLAAEVGPPAKGCSQI